MNVEDRIESLEREKEVLKTQLDNAPNDWQSEHILNQIDEIDRLIDEEKKKK